MKVLVKQDQMAHFKNVHEYYDSPCSKVKNIPNIVNQLNVFRDEEGVLRVRSKCNQKVVNNRRTDPILLAKKSRLVYLIIVYFHEKMYHAGKYMVLSEIRKEYYVSAIYSLVKKVVKDCILCRKLNERPISLNQSNYRDFRISPPSVPFRSIVVDFMGPFKTRLKGVETKTYVLCITCVWSRAVNLKVCRDLTVESFLMALQTHINEFGVPQTILSDSGSQLTVASKLIVDLLKDTKTTTYLNRHNVKNFQFTHYPAGNSSLGSLVEIIVKFAKRLLHGSVGKNMLDYLEFELHVSAVTNILNKRPIAFAPSLRDDSGENIPSPISPEMLIHGFELPTVNVIPNLEIPLDPDFRVENVPSKLQKLNKVQDALYRVYNEEFTQYLVELGSKEKNGFIPVKHKKLEVGDLVLITDKLVKQSQYPMGIVRKVFQNELGEVTSASVYKGKTGELIDRHVNALIFLKSTGHTPDSPVSEAVVTGNRDRSTRLAAQICRDNIRSLMKDN